MRSTHSREQDFMAITAEIEILCQWLKLKGMYSVPSPQPSTAGVKPNHNVHFQPINPGPKSPVQSSNQGIFNPLLNLVDDSPQPPSSSSSSSIPCGQSTPQGSTQSSNSLVHTPVPHAPYTMVPPTPSWACPETNCFYSFQDHSSPLFMKTSRFSTQFLIN